MNLTADDQAAIQRLYAQYSQAIDLGSPQEFADVFTDDALLRTEMGDYVGREALEGFATWFRTEIGSNTRHWPANLVLQADGESVNGKAYFGAFQVGAPTGPVPIASGRYTDVLVKTDGGWRFASRDIAMDKPAS